jgi:autotransporter-associated beta strand protein
LNVSGNVVAALPSADPANASLPASADAEGYIRFGMTTVQNTGTGVQDTGTINLLPGGVLETSRQFVVGGTFYNTSITVVNQTGYLNFRGGTLETDGTNPVTDWFPVSATTGGGAPTNYNALTGVYISGPSDPSGSGAYINTNGASATISYPMTDNPTYAGGALTKLGLGILTLSGADSYTGGTTVSAGTLDVTGSLSKTISLFGSGSGSTIELASNDDINHAARVTLGSGSTLQILANLTETMSDLTRGRKLYFGSRRLGQHRQLRR